jgi:hypothetical protein
VKPLGIDTGRMPKSCDGAGQKEIEGLDLLAVLFALIQICKRLHHSGAADADAPYGRSIFERELFNGQALSSPDEV